jgi:hypothetical protein
MDKTTPIEMRAINFAMSVLRTANDWQDGEHALADHDVFGPWIEESGNAIAEAQRIIRKAEAKLGDQLPY